MTQDEIIEMARQVEGDASMIEVLKQAAEDVSKAYDVLAFANTERALELLAKTRTSLRQAIAGLESQEPVALETVYETIIQWDEGGGKRSRRDLARRIIDLYTHPPQRTWVGLTNDEVNNIAAGCHLGNSVQDAIFRAEAKLKERNT